MLLPALLAIFASSGAGSSATSKDVDKEREKEDKDRLARQRSVLRIVAELAIIGAWAEGVRRGAGEVQKILKGLVSRLQMTAIPVLRDRR